MENEEIDTTEIEQEIEAEAAPTVEETAEVQETNVEAQPANEVNTNPYKWSDYGLPHFEGRKPEEIASYIKTTLKRYGDQANELGELRKLKEKFGKVEETVSGKTEQKSKKLDEYQYKVFADKFIDDPIGALDEFYLPNVKERLLNEIMTQLDGKIKPQIEGYAQGLTIEQSFRQFAKSNPDYVQVKDLMSDLMTEEHLGENAEYEDVYSLAKLYKSNSSVASETYQLMKRGLPFIQAKRYAEAVVSAPVNNEQAKNKIKTEVGQIRQTSAPSGVKAVPSGKTMNTWDDVEDEVMKELGIS